MADDPDGGAIYSEGKVSFFEDATFVGNEGGVSALQDRDWAT